MEIKSKTFQGMCHQTFLKKDSSGGIRNREPEGFDLKSNAC